ncbi:MAG: hypothetical protein WCG26_09240 [Chloroflexales bacterium]
MSIDLFTRRQFEDALAAIGQRITAGQAQDDGPRVGPCIYHPMGLDFGEYSYALFVRPERNIRIVVRSSVGYTGYAADTGADSIRLIVQCSDGTGWYAVGKGADAYTTRVPGWQTRLEAKLRALYERWSGVRMRLAPGERIFLVKAAGPNQGRAFVKDGERWVAWL